MGEIKGADVTVQLKIGASSMYYLKMMAKRIENELSQFCIERGGGEFPDGLPEEGVTPESIILDLIEDWVFEEYSCEGDDRMSEYHRGVLYNYLAPRGLTDRLPAADGRRVIAPEDKITEEDVSFIRSFIEEPTGLNVIPPEERAGYRSYVAELIEKLNANAYCVPKVERRGA